MSSSAEQQSSEVQNQLQGVLVTVKIQDPEKDIKEKRVRFNSLVEVRFIPKVKTKKEKNKEEKEKRKAEDRVNCDGSCEGKENVATGDENDTKNEAKNTHESSTEKKKIKDKTNVKVNPESHNCGESTNVVAREGFFLPKVTIGHEYEGEVLRTTKVTTKPQPRNSINRLMRRVSKESRINDLSAKAVVHLERQATEFCKEAERLFEESASQDGGHSSPSRRENVNETQTTLPSESNKDQELINPVLQRCKSFPDFSRRTSLPTSSMTVQEKGTENSQKKLSTSLPYINMIPTLTGKTPETYQKDSYTKLYLPQLQRKAEEIKRLNDTVLRKKPKYSPDRSPSSPSDSTSPIGFNGDKNFDKNTSPPASSHSIVRYSHGLDIARLLNVTNSTQLFY